MGGEAFDHNTMSHYLSLVFKSKQPLPISKQKNLTGSAFDTNKTNIKHVTTRKHSILLDLRALPQTTPFTICYLYNSLRKGKKIYGIVF